jgi:putative peptidoglycan lipid II flippase
MSSNATQLAKSAGLISLATMLSRVLGLVREQLIAHLFSRTATDAFYVAFRIPNLLRDLFAEGALSSAFVPTFTDYLHKKSREEAWRMASTVTNLILVLLSLITILGILASNWLVDKFAGYYRSVPGKFELTVLMTQIMFPFLPMVALAAIAMGILNSHGRFFIPALAPALFNVGSIAVALILHLWLPQHSIEPVLGMAIGTLLGGLLQLLIQTPLLFKQGLKYFFTFDFRNPGVQRILILMGPGTLGLAANQINIFVNTWLATSQEEGAVSWLNYAFRLMHFPIGIFGVAIATAALPVFSRHVSRGETEELQRSISSSLRMIFLLNIPASLGLIFLSTPIISLIYQHGRFKVGDTQSTASALMFYSIGLFAYSAVKLLVPVFYALGHSRIPVVVSASAVASNIALNLILVGPLGYRGLALGTSLTSILNFLLLFYWLQKYTGSLHAIRVIGSFLKILAASLIMGVVCYCTHRWFSSFALPDSLLWKVSTLSCTIGIGLVILFFSCRVLRISEMESAAKIVMKKIRSGA